MNNYHEPQSHILGLPRSCKSAMERMINELDREDAEGRYAYARLTSDACRSIHQLEDELSRSLERPICLVAYEKEEG